LDQKRSNNSLCMGNDCLFAQLITCSLPVCAAHHTLIAHLHGLSGTHCPCTWLVTCLLPNYHLFPWLVMHLLPDYCLFPQLVTHLFPDYCCAGSLAHASQVIIGMSCT
jgi:hypothetical protein